MPTITSPPVLGDGVVATAQQVADQRALEAVWMRAPHVAGSHPTDEVGVVVCSEPLDTI
jgi:hypothetical protein